MKPDTFVSINLVNEIGIAIISELFSHVTLDDETRYFIKVDWLKKKRIDVITGFPIMGPTEKDDYGKVWKKIFPIQSILTTPFLEHCCTKGCQVDERKLNHSTNKEYLFNTIYNHLDL